MKNLINRRRLNQVAAVCLLVVALMSTGCMMTPGNGEVFQERGSTIDIFGAGLDPDETVEIQARRPGVGSWQTVGTADTAFFATRYFGVDFYLYGTLLTVPDSLWSYDVAARRYRTEIRVVDSDGGNLLAFEDGMDDYFWDYDANVGSDLSAMYADHGAGTSVIIYAIDP